MWRVRPGYPAALLPTLYPGKRTISPEVRARVAEAVRELGYTPNAGARALATSRTNVIALWAGSSLMSSHRQCCNTSSE